MNSNSNTNCKVQGCRFLLSHVTKGHKCGKCNDYGHGETECKNDLKKQKLKQYFLEELNDELKCKFGGCKYSKYHTTDAHHCSDCGGRLHSNATCLLKIEIKINIPFDIKCPLCKKDNLILKNQTKIYGLSDTCVVCLNNNVEVFLPNCGHACLCLSCLSKLDKHSSEKLDINVFEDIRNETFLQSQLYNIDEIKSKLLTHPTYVTVYEGMGCYTIIRRLNSESKIEGLFVHSDDNYSLNKMKKNEDFINGYAHINIQSLFHEWTGQIANTTHLSI